MAEQEQVEPTEGVEEVSPLEVIEVLERDLHIAQVSFHRILRINPANIGGGSGPNNKRFGRRYEQALEAAQKEAMKALEQMESHVV